MFVEIYRMQMIDVVLKKMVFKYSLTNIIINDTIFSYGDKDAQIIFTINYYRFEKFYIHFYYIK